MRNLLVITVILLLISCGTRQQPADQEWIQLFNGKDLNDWSVKIKGYKLNDNSRNIFRVEDGVMKVRYDDFDKFRDEFGHIFYKKPFSRYKLRIEYRFTGDQVPGAPAWAYRNSGVMLHSQSPESMGVDQDFPVSVEGQFLGGDGINERSTGNVCTPGTNIVMDGELITQHCINSSSRTYHGDVWVRAEFVVLGDSVIHHIIEGDTVLTYFKPQVGGAPEDYPVPEGTLLNQGYICLQAESHPVEFRKVELLDLSKGRKQK
ncbi:MAG TPA: DUF1080 domain-containing protein [Bacteroidales bacterium]|jgi:hypothetical protein|nr:DUF1080 domain-containing protein [Bacteroidales bacterium]HNR41127.1 DUF1080 domain-containing protein [Bacteroidales bacterium]HPM17520.1 DUF1080 domain-containing protein [Bacteroidales bacterium]HQH24709.1 DUF1080 domain-containing protein [Bacteroidales bacterium]